MMWLNSHMKLHMASAAVVILLAASPVAAQARESELKVSASAIAGYDSDATESGIVDPRLQEDGTHVGGQVGLSHAFRTARINLTNNIGSVVRYYQISQRLSTTSVSGGSGLAVNVSPKLRARGSVHAGYSPQFEFTVFPAANGRLSSIAPSLGPSLDYSLAVRDIITYQADLGLAYHPTNRSTLDLMYNLGQMNFAGTDYRLRTRSYAGRYSRNLTQYATLVLGYGEQEGEYSIANTPRRKLIRNRMLDAGVGYSRPLSLSRRTTVAFGSGSSMLDNREETFYMLTGNASLEHQIGRTWSLNLAYTRGLSLMGGFTEPLFADSLLATLEGSVSRRVQLNTSVDFSNGSLGLGSRGASYDSYRGFAGVDYMLNRELSLFGNYFYYHYLFGERASLLGGIPRRLDRHGVRAGLTYTFPLLKGTPRVTR
jgi:opacity protein-like surface antigen